MALIAASGSAYAVSRARRAWGERSMASSRNSRPLLSRLRGSARSRAARGAGPPDDLLSGPTPCAAYSLGDLLDHIRALPLAFTAAATKETEGIGSRPPSGDAARLGGDWRTRIPRDLDALGAAW